MYTPLKLNFPLNKIQGLYDDIEDKKFNIEFTLISDRNGLEL